MSFSTKMFLIYSLTVILSLLAYSLDAQQTYVGNSAVGCDNIDGGGLYSCNGEKPFCKAFLIFTSQNKYNTVTTISNLTSVSPRAIAFINNISTSAVLPFGKEVILPVNCSCSGQYYQAKTSYIINYPDENYFTIANDTYQGLSTCVALVNENPYDKNALDLGMNLRVPLRCACPTRNQTTLGVKFLLTYLVTVDDTVYHISEQFNVTEASVANANAFSELDETIFPFTPLLIPLPEEPSSFQTVPRLYPVVDSPPFTPLRNSKHNSSYSYKAIYIGVAIGSCLSVICCSLFFFLFCHKGGKIDDASYKNKGLKNLKLVEDILGSIASEDQTLKIYQFEELEAATENFASEKRLSACVYRGVLRGKLMAIKKMSKDVQKEVQMLQKLNHFNLINLSGVSHGDGVYYLVFEFMENGSLKEWLQKDNNPDLQLWKFRIRIALDVASGLEYLHSYTFPAYVHKNLNSSNILLNGDLRAKLTDFSCARSAYRVETWSSSSLHSHGTKGYIAPEYLETGQVTPKMDVYAFGVVLLELITGKYAVFEQDGEAAFLSKMVQSIIDGENVENAAAVANIIDSRLQVRHPLGYIIDQTEVAIRLVKLSASCLEPKAERRISMAEVVSALSKIRLDIENQNLFSIE